MKYYRFILVLLLGFNVEAALAQLSDLTDDLEHQFNEYHQNNYQESIYIHADKRYYLTGEFIKFKVYCLERTTGRTSRLSMVAYVEILDSENNAELQARIELKDGQGSGEFYLPMDLASDNYIIRGYTRWMRNFGPEHYFHAMVKIINPFKRPDLKPVTDTLMVDFYPEGGQLINGLETKVVFHGKNNLGIPADVEGRLIANDTMVITEFNSIREGLGHFTFTPDLAHKYHIEVKVGDGYAQQDFIDVASRGFNTQIDIPGNEYLLKLFCNEPSIAQPDEKLTMILHQKGTIILSDDISLNHGIAKYTIDPSYINGVVCASIFDSNANLLAERKIYNKPERLSTGNISLNKLTATNREKIEIDISNLKSYSNLSVSVSANHPYFDDNMPGMDQFMALDNSINFLYGIETYLQGTPQESNTLLNDLLIAYPVRAGDKIFDSEDHTIEFIPEHRSVLVTGKLLDKRSKEPAFGILTYLSVPGKITQIYAAKSEKDGALIFEAGNFYGSNQVVVQNNYITDSTYNIELDNPYSAQFAEVIVPEFDLDESLEDLLIRKSQQMQVYNANLKISPNYQIVSNQDSASFYVEPDMRYYLDDYTRFVVMEEVMREYIAGVNVRRNKEGFHFMVIDVVRDIVYDDNPLMLLDGVPVFDADDIIALDPLKIEKIETIKTRFGRGVLDCKGVVTYTSYAGDLAGYQLPKSAVVLDYDGLRPLKKYHFPIYNLAYEINNPTPDFRSNLYWNPEIDLEQLEEGKIEFYTSDDADDYEVRINGLSEDGVPVSVKKRFNVIRTLK